MKPTAVLIGAPLSGDEARFLRRLYADLAEGGALILANFIVGRRQVDFVVVTSEYAALLELKNYTAPLFGHENGQWSYSPSSGCRIPCAGFNAYQQTLQQKHELSDEMARYAKQSGRVPRSLGRQFYYEFDAFVCVFPAIHADSEVTRGDHRVAVGSYSDVVEQLRTGGKPSAWTLDNWRQFAEAQLRLTAVTLEQATDARVATAHESVRSYCSRVRALFGHALPPLIGSGDNPNFGRDLIQRALRPENVMFVGPSGSSKTFHLHHLAVALAESQDEVPVFVEAKRFKGGDFWTLLKQELAPLFRGDPKELLHAFRVCGLRPVLIVDALNECRPAHLDDLIRGAQAFVVQWDARLIAASQRQIALPADLVASAHEVRLPDGLQKRLIYAHHAGLAPTEDLDEFCTGFANAYELSLAGCCHQAGEKPQSRTELYDRYVHRVLGSHAVILGGVLRRVAGAMSDSICTVLPRATFEGTVERYGRSQQVPGALLDELYTLRLLEVTEDTVSFEHELLLDYFRADSIEKNAADAAEAAAVLSMPRNQELLELVLPRYSVPAEIDALLATARESSVLGRVAEGRAGVAAQTVLFGRCERLLREAVADLSNIQLVCHLVDRADGLRAVADVSVSGCREWSHYDLLLCDVIATNLGRPELRSGLLRLVDITEWALRAAGRRCASRLGLDPAALWAEVVRVYSGVLQHGILRLPCTAILSSIRSMAMVSRREGVLSAIRTDLIARTEREPRADFALVALLEDRTASRVPGNAIENLRIVERALESGIYILRLNALEYLQATSGAVAEQCPDQIPRVRKLLEGLGSADIMLNTVILETMTCYGGLELSVTVDDAVGEMRALISEAAMTEAGTRDLAALFEVSPEELLASQAYGCLTKIFEDVFQGVYMEAYGQLSRDEKASILRLAARTPELGIFSDWLLLELLEHDGQEALPAYRRFAAGIDGSSGFAQETVATFVLGVKGCARWSDAPPVYVRGGSTDHRAWQIVGEILFWLFRGGRRDDELAALWDQVKGPLALAAADVLYQLTHSSWRLRDHDHSVLDLVDRFPVEIGRIVGECLSHQGGLTSVFSYGGSRDPGVVRFLIHSAAAAPTPEAIGALQALADDAVFGKDAIQALRTIGRRRTSPLGGPPRR